MDGRGKRLTSRYPPVCETSAEGPRAKANRHARAEAGGFAADPFGNRKPAGMRRPQANGSGTQKGPGQAGAPHANRPWRARDGGRLL